MLSLQLIIYLIFFAREIRVAKESSWQKTKGGIMQPQNQKVP